MSAQEQITDQTLEIAELETERLALSEVTPHPDNPRIHTKEQARHKHRNRAILFDHLNGDKTAMIAERYGVTNQVVNNVLRLQGIRKKADIEQRNANVFKFVRRGGSIKAAADRFGVTQVNVKSICTKNGGMRERGDAVCIICNISFKQHRYDQVCCSGICERKRARTQKRPYVFRTCENCGTKYRRRSNQSWYQRFCGQACHKADRFKHLEERNQEIWYLRHIQGLTFERIGEIFDIHRSTARHNYRKQVLKRNLRLAELGL